MPVCVHVSRPRCVGLDVHACWTQAIGGKKWRQKYGANYENFPSNPTQKDGRIFFFEFAIKHNSFPKMTFENRFPHFFPCFSTIWTQIPPPLPFLCFFPPNCFSSLLNLITRQHGSSKECRTGFRGRRWKQITMENLNDWRMVFISCHCCLGIFVHAPAPPSNANPEHPVADLPKRITMFIFEPFSCQMRRGFCFSKWWLWYKTSLNSSGCQLYGKHSLLFQVNLPFSCYVCTLVFCVQWKCGNRCGPNKVFVGHGCSMKLKFSPVVTKIEVRRRGVRWTRRGIGSPLTSFVLLSLTTYQYFRKKLNERLQIRWLLIKNGIGHPEAANRGSPEGGVPPPCGGPGRGVQAPKRPKLQKCQKMPIKQNKTLQVWAGQLGFLTPPHLFPLLAHFAPLWEK